MSADTIALELYDSSNLGMLRNYVIASIKTELRITKIDEFLPLLNSGYNKKQVKYRYKMYRYDFRKSLRDVKNKRITNSNTIEYIISEGEGRSCWYFEGKYYLKLVPTNTGNVLFRMRDSHNKILHSYDETCSFLQKFENDVSAFKNLPNYDEILKFWKYHNDRLIYVG